MLLKNTRKSKEIFDVTDKYIWNSNSISQVAIIKLYTHQNNIVGSLLVGAWHIAQSVRC